MPMLQRTVENQITQRQMQKKTCTKTGDDSLSSFTCDRCHRYHTTSQKDLERHQSQECEALEKSIEKQEVSS